MKVFEEIYIGNYKKFFKNLNIDCNYRYIFRGQENDYPKMQTTLVRYLDPKEPHKNKLKIPGYLHKTINTKYINKIIEGLKIIHPDLTISSIYDKPFYSFFQHYESKTNLLDWTLDPDTALYFAIFGTNKHFTMEKKLNSWTDQKVYLYSIKVHPTIVDLKQVNHPKGTLSIYDPLNLLNWNKPNSIYHHYPLSNLNE